MAKHQYRAFTPAHERRIDLFRGGYFFLSNFYPCDFTWQGWMPDTSRQYTTVEHAFQAAKARTSQEHDWVASAATPADAKNRSRKVALIANWDQRRVQVMKSILLAKFSNPDLADRLRRTGSAKLVEGNHWGDTFWGVCRGVGENHLGKLLMGVRMAGMTGRAGRIK